MIAAKPRQIRTRLFQRLSSATAAMGSVFRLKLLTHRFVPPIKSHVRHLQSLARVACLLRQAALRHHRTLHKIPDKMAAAPEVASPSLSNFFPNLWRRYLAVMDAYPLRTQGITSVMFAGLGNFVSQTVVEKRSFSNLDWPSIIKFSVINACFTFPLIRSWLWTLEQIVKPGRWAPVKKVLIDQLCFAPVFLAAFIVLMGFVEGKGWEDSKERLKHDWVNVMISNYGVWPAAQFLNFYFVPFNHRILFGSVVSLGWNTYLAFVVRQGTGTRSLPEV